MGSNPILPKNYILHIMARKINLNILQIMKFGSHIGGTNNLITSSSKPYLTGTRKSVSLIDASIMISSLRRIIFLSKKILLRRSAFLLCNSIDDRLSKSMSKNISQSGIFTKTNRVLVPGAITNSQLFKKKFFSKKTSASNVKKSIRNNLKEIFSAIRTPVTPSKSPARAYNRNFIKKYSLPSALIVLGFETPLGYYSVLNSRKKKLISISFLDTNNIQNVTDYTCLINNKSSSSMNFLIKVLKNIDFKSNYLTI